ncbi:hypothetical protein BW716_35105 [[Flexibacter] sp. ATCC 35208]|nr:hypothetical protein BW716_35105 [[Flexibacter] sp. ATCC 35208]
MRIFMGQLILLVTINFCIHSSFNDYTYQNAFNPEMLLWTIALLGMGIWTLWYPRLAFVLIWIYYLATAIYRFFILEIEIFLFLLWHIIFIIVISVSIWGAYSKKNYGSNNNQILKMLFKSLMNS